MARSDRRRLVGAVIGATAVTALSLAAACNDLIGLSDYSQGDCNGGGICSDAAFGDGSLPPPPSKDAGVVDASPPIDATGTKPVRWAHFVMPNYAQDGGPGQNVLTYSASTIDGGVYDSVSKLTWLVTPMASATYDGALIACANVPGGWRLPSRIELVTLLNLASSTAKIDATAFPKTESTQYWTTSEVRTSGGGVSGSYWTVDFNTGGLSQQDGTSGKAAVRCIKDQ